MKPNAENSKQPSEETQSGVSVSAITIVRHRARLAIETAKRIGERDQNWNLAWYILRDLEAVKMAGLSDLVWAGHHQGDVHKSDFNGLVCELEEWLKMTNTRTERSGGQ